jgi:Flp pilus assembly protein TadD
MRYFPGARNQVIEQLTSCGHRCARSRARRPKHCGLAALFCLAAWASPVWAHPGWGQDSGSRRDQTFGKGAEISVTVHDGAGEPISSPAIVRLYKDGSVLSGQGATQQGRMAFLVTSVGDFTLVVQAAGYADVQKEVSAPVEGKTQVDVYLHREADGGSGNGVPGRPILAPKAKEAFDGGLRALSADKLREAVKFVSEAARLAPGHPDVLYVQGVLYLKQRNWVEAQSALEKATQVDPDHARAYAALGMALSDQGKYDAAIAPLEKALQLDAAAGFETHWALAKAYYQSGRYGEALRNSQVALAESKGRAPEIALLVAQALTAVGRYEEAGQVLREFLREHGERADAGKARRWLEGLRSSGRVRE